jgi:hypothetical protein
VLAGFDATGVGEIRLRLESLEGVIAMRLLAPRANAPALSRYRDAWNQNASRISTKMSAAAISATISLPEAPRWPGAGTPLGRSAFQVDLVRKFIVELLSQVSTEQVAFQ